MKNKLVLITQEYPYNFGESFIEEELKHLSLAFQEIEIVVVNPAGNKRAIPKNCRILEYRMTNSVKQNLYLIGLLLRNVLFLLRRIACELKIIRKIYRQKITRPIAGQMLHDLCKGIQLCAYLRKYTDINNSIYYSYWLDNKALALAVLREKEKNVISVSRVHGGDLYFEVNKKNYISFQRYKAQKLSAIFFISEQGLLYLKNRIKLEADNFYLAKLGTRNPWTVGDRKPEKYFTIVSCSNMLAVKRIHLIIEALGRMDTVPVCWLHIGGGPLELELRNLAEELLDKKENVTYHFLGQLSNEEVHRFYASHAIDLFLNVSISEGLPVSLMEAISYKIPIMATQVGGSAEICNDRTGVLLPADLSAQSLAAEITAFALREKNERVHLGESAFTYWKAYFCAAENFSRFVEKLKEF